MMLQTIQSQLKDAMRAKDSLKLDTLRFVLSQLKYAQIEKQRELSDEEALDVLAKEVKKRRDAIELFRNSGRDALVTEEEAKLAVILTLLPAQLEEAELSALIDDVIAHVGTANLGMLMKEVMAKVKGKADGRTVSDLIKRKIT